MKRKLFILSEEYCAAKKLPILDMPDLSNITTKSELNLSCLKEQNKNLAVLLEQHKLKQVEQSKKIHDSQTLNSKLTNIIVEFKNALIILLGNIDMQNEVPQESDNNKTADVYLKELDNLLSNIQTNTADEILSEITTVKDKLLESLKQSISHQNSLDQLSYETTKLNHSNGGTNLINFEKMKTAQNEKIKHLEYQLETSTQKYEQSKLELIETLEYMDILRHKIYTMHDRYEEKLEFLEKATNELTKEKAQLCNQAQLIPNTKLLEHQQFDIATTNLNDGTVAQIEKELDDKTVQLNQLRTDYDELERVYNKLNLDYQNLQTAHQLLCDIPITIKPEYKILADKNDELNEDNAKLREYLEFFWNILAEIKNVIKENANKFRETISKHIHMLIENINQLEVERDQLRYQGIQDSIEKQRCQEQIKQLHENINELTNINKTLKNQSNFYSSQLKKQHEDLKTKNIDDVHHFDNITTTDVAITQLKLQNNLIKQLRAEQETFIAEMEITLQSYEETYDQNTSLLDKLKEKQNSNLRLSSDLFKCNQSIQLLNSRLTNCENISTYNNNVLEKHSTDLQNRLSGVDSLQISLEKHLNNATFKTAQQTDKNTPSIDEQLQFKQHELEVNEIQLTKIIEEKSNLQMDLGKSNQLIDNLKSNVDSLQKQLDEQIKSNTINTTTNVSTDEILNEQIRMYKSKLTCACCNSNPINAIIYKCFHLFCHDCLQLRYDTRQRKCPNCNMTFGLNDFHRVFF